MKKVNAKHAQDHSLVGEFMHTWFRLGQAIKREVVPLLERKHGADFFDFMVLRSISDGALYPGQVAEACVVEPSKISRALDGLVKRGLIVRSLDPVDSRRVRLELTAEGDGLLQDVFKTVRSRMEPSFASVGVPQVHAVIATVAQIADIVSDPKEHPKP